MCEIAPFQMKCVYDGFDMTACAVHKLNCALTELEQAIPFFGKHIPSYQCPDFEIEAGGKDELFNK